MFTVSTKSRHPSADELNAFLADGGVVQVTTHLKSWVYDSPAHAGMFRNSARDGKLQVRSGKSWLCCEYCAIRTGRYVQVD